MNPSHGGRILLDRDPDAPGAVSYRVTLFSPDARWSSRARVALAGGEVSFEDFEPPQPPAWMVATARALLRAAWKDRQREGAEPWPGRMLRWKTEKT